MSLHEISPDTLARSHQDSKATPAQKRGKRPLTGLQEALFFGVTFALAVLLQLAVILKFANIISW